MNNPYFYKNASNQTVFVLLEKGKGGELWTNEQMPVKFNSITDALPFTDLKGRKVKFGNCEGIITDCHPYHCPLKGKYIGEAKYLTHKNLLNMNNLVQIFWTKGFAQTWQPYFKLTLMDN